MKNLNIFIPLTKIDVEKRLVYGIATAETPDKSGEIMDYDSTVPYYKKWSGEIEKSSGGKSLGNLRSMHASVAAGKLTQIHFNDAEKQIEICAKVVDDNEWKKVDEGVYTGFSQGGRYIKTWKDPGDESLTRYTAEPSEVSLVDNPCLGSATFEVVKADGATELRKFKTKETEMTVETVADGKPLQPKFKAVQKWEASDGKTFEKKDDWRVYELELEAGKAVKPALDALDALNKAVEEKEIDPMTLGKKDFSEERRKKLAESGAALPDGSFPISSVQDLKNAIHAYGRAKDKEKAKAHIIARAKALGEEKLLPEGWGEKEAAKTVLPKLKKGMFEVARAANLIQELEWLTNSLVWEAAAEGDNSGVPDHFRQIITELCTALEAMVTEECHELAEPHAVELMGADCMEMAAAIDTLSKFIEKKNEEALTKAWNAFKENNATQLAELKEKGQTKTAKVDDGEMKKVADQLTSLTEKNAALENENTGMKQALEKFTQQMPTLIERIKKLEQQPLPGKGALYETPAIPVKKGHEAQKDPAAPVEAKSIPTGESPEMMRQYLGIR